jgi:hypothetical protein
MDTKHTPGPWVATTGNHGEWNINSVDDDGGWAVAVVMGGAGLEDPNGRSDENARLIAAAPDLLEALTEARKGCKLLDDLTGCMGDDDSVRELLAKIDAAIARANLAPVAGLERVG